MPWVNWINAAIYPYPSMVWNVEPVPHFSLAAGSPQSGSCPSICNKTSHTLTQHISRITWYQGESKTERVQVVSSLDDGVLLDFWNIYWLNVRTFWRNVGTFNHYMVEKHKKGNHLIDNHHKNHTTYTECHNVNRECCTVLLYLSLVTQGPMRCMMTQFTLFEMSAIISFLDLWIDW